MLLLSTIEKLRVIVRRSGVSMATLADKTQQTRQNLHNKLTRGNFTESQLRQLADVLGYDVEIIFVNREDGERI